MLNVNSTFKLLSGKSDRLRNEQIDLLYAQAPVSLIATVVNSIILCAVLWRTVSHTVLLAWLLSNLMLVGLLYRLLITRRRVSGEGEESDRRASLFVIGLAASGILMGSAGIFLFPSESFMHQVFLAFLLGGLVAGAAGAYSVVVQAFLAFSVPLVAPTIVRLLIQESEFQIVTGGLLLLLTAVMVATAYQIHRTTRRSLELRFENSSLIAGLTASKAQAETVVDALRSEISERRRAEAALSESERKFRSLVETMNEGLGVMNENGSITYVNDKFCEMLGFSREELLGQPVDILFDGTADLRLEEEMTRRRLRKRTSYEVELLTKNRRKIPAIVAASPVFDEQERFRGIIATTTDITILKRAEKKLRESEEKYRMIFENSPLGIVHFDKDGVVTACNENLVAMSGLGKDQVIGTSLLEVVRDDRVLSAISDCLSGRAGHFEGYYHWMASDRTSPLKADYGTILAEDGSVAGGIGVIEDISERKRAEEELQDQLRFLQTLIDTIPNPVFYKDSKGSYMGCNKTFQMQLGLKKEGIVGKTVFDLLPGDLAEEYHQMDLELFKRPGAPIVYETSFAYADGRRHDVIINKAAFTNADGTVAGLVGVTVDITERKQAEKTLQRAHDELETRVQKRTVELARRNEELRIEIAERERVEEALRSTTENLKFFAYSVVHDLKSPAVGIYGLTRLLHNRYKEVLDDSGRKICEQILNASEHVAALVEKINVYVATKEAPMSFEEVNALEILRMVRDEFSTQLSVRRIDWTEPERVPTVRADRLSMLRVFRNLVDNALKYGGERLSAISVGYEDSEAFHVFSVSDNGEGLKGEDSEKIFDLFQRNPMSSTIEGAGLGLAIVKEIAVRHGGDIWVESEHETGTRFCISIAKYL